MSSYKSFIVDAFTNTPFAGNPAAVCFIEKKLTTDKYQQIAAEFNLSETAFPVPLDGESYQNASRFSLRWFTPTVEVNLCGHATLATAHAIFNESGNANDAITFETKSGELTVSQDKEKKKLVMNFPQFTEWVAFESPLITPGTNQITTDIPRENAPEFVNEFVKLLTPNATCAYLALSTESKKLLIVLPDTVTRNELLSLTPNAEQLLKVHDGSKVRGVVVTVAPKDAKKQEFVDGNDREFDYVSRYFAPWVGIPEDPATGSSQSALAPFWAKAKGFNGPFYAYQCFPGRGALFNLELTSSKRLNIVGQAVTVLRGELSIN
uniref:Phenazine biosynthesis-like domain-containing protein n=1 Tax=Panagrellus redivivus TaxID=6233 RepID=A0A7E4URZ9_PANRE